MTLAHPLLRLPVTLVAPLLVLALWYWVAANELAPATLLVPPAQVLETLWLMLGSGELVEASGITLARVAAGFLAGSLVGIATGVVLALSPRVDRNLGLAINLLAQVPAIAWTPLIIFLLGIDEAYKVFLIAFACYFPVAVKTREGILGLSPRLLEAAAALALPPALRYRKVILPGALPALLAGLRIGLSKAWIAAIFGELFASSSGLGYLMNSGRIYFQMDMVLAAMLATGVLGFLSDRFLLWLHDRLPGARP
ncbi:ABC transporter permease [Pseudomonas sp. JM0905a]|uniref:ABC transporter permease n=1 Tax=Pseudomonas sp. JM0905a TaxID=2772484 RepID=UPI001686DF7C|nr:ABC transporter permease [Pseudomonas sp. JM0905a]MBD2840337.1 ABC transporter permease [Pseudomonas sp. JM0905a]